MPKQRTHEKGSDAGTIEAALHGYQDVVSEYVTRAEVLNSLTGTINQIQLKDLEPITGFSYDRYRSLAPLALVQQSLLPIVNFNDKNNRAAILPNGSMHAVTREIVSQNQEGRYLLNAFSLQDTILFPQADQLVDNGNKVGLEIPLGLHTRTRQLNRGISTTQVTLYQNKANTIGVAFCARMVSLDPKVYRDQSGNEDAQYRNALDSIREITLTLQAQLDDSNFQLVD